MAASTKLATSVKALCHLAETYPHPQSSQAISRVLGVNASKLRQLLSLLSRGGIVVSTMGKAGGFLLNKDPRALHLQEIYCAVEDRKAFFLDTGSRDDNNERSAAFNHYFLDLYDGIQLDIEDRMRTISIASVMSRLGLVSAYSNSKQQAF
ncbi:MAG: Rrf2 family transcriptional regulator [Desulfobacterales bacterium]|nr:Rrf2 family transcriptional regulator [Desulfobacterales bacterium]